MTISEQRNVRRFRFGYEDFTQAYESIVELCSGEFVDMTERQVIIEEDASGGWSVTITGTLTEVLAKAG